MTTYAKKQEEKAIFERLAHLAGLSIVPGSIRQKDPPAPDIECTLSDSVSMAAELVALDNSDTRTRINNLLDTRQWWFDVLSQHANAAQTILRATGKNLVLRPGFTNGAGKRDRKRAFRAAQNALLQLPPYGAGFR